jgi:hypothetical protein
MGVKLFRIPESGDMLLSSTNGLAAPAPTEAGLAYKGGTTCGSLS